MAKLTNRDRRELRRVLGEMEWAFDFLMQDDVVVCRESRMTSANVYHNAMGDPPIHRITKELGSPLVGFDTAIRALAHFLSTH